MGKNNFQGDWENKCLVKQCLLYGAKTMGHIEDL